MEKWNAFPSFVIYTN